MEKTAKHLKFLFGYKEHRSEIFKGLQIPMENH